MFVSTIPKDVYYYILFVIASVTMHFLPSFDSAIEKVVAFLAENGEHVIILSCTCTLVEIELVYEDNSAMDLHPFVP